MALRELQRFCVVSPFDDIMSAIAADGCAIVENFISPDLVSRLTSQLAGDATNIAPGAERVSTEMLQFWGSQTKRFTRLTARAPAFAELLDHDLMHAWARSALEGDYWLNTGQAMIVGPGEKQQVLHRDIGIWPGIAALGKDGPEALVSILLALSDFTADVGATRGVLGSHLWDEFQREPEGDDIVQAVMPAGSAFLYTGKTMHGAGANVTADRWRFGLHMSFCLGWLTPEEASPIGVSWDIARQYSPRVQRMLGYSSSHPGNPKSPVNWTVDFQDIRGYLGVVSE